MAREKLMSWYSRLRHLNLEKCMRRGSVRRFDLEEINRDWNAKHVFKEKCPERLSRGN